MVFFEIFLRDKINPSSLEREINRSDSRAKIPLYSNCELGEMGFRNPPALYMVSD